MSDTQAKVDALIRERLELVLEAGVFGFASAQAAQVKLGEIDVKGVELDGEDDTVRPGFLPTFTLSSVSSVSRSSSVSPCAPLVL